MKRTDILQLVVLITALLIGYQALMEIPPLIWYIYKLITGSGDIDSFRLNASINFLCLGLFVLMMVLLIKNSKVLGRYLADLTGFETDLSFSQSASQLLTITLIAIGVYIICSKVPLLLNNFYEYFKNSYLSSDERSRLGYLVMTADKTPVLIMQIVLAIVLVGYSKKISNYCLSAVQPVDEEHNIGEHLKEE